MSTSMDSGSDTNLTPKHPVPYEYLYLAKSGRNSIINHYPQQQSLPKLSPQSGGVGGYVHMKPKQLFGQQQQHCSLNYENAPQRSYNQNRKLRRNTDNERFEKFCVG